MIWVLKEQGIAVVGDDVDIYLLTNDAHGAQLVGRDGADDDAVVVVVKRLHLGKVSFNFIVDGLVEVGKEDGMLHACASLSFEILGHVSPYLIAFDVVHHEEEHVSWFSLRLVYDA